MVNDEKERLITCREMMTGY